MEHKTLIRMIEKAKRSDKEFEPLLKLLKPELDFLSHLICVSRFKEDALQMARIRIWHSLKKINTNNEAKAKAYLLKVATNAMCRWVSKHKSPSHVLVEADSDVIIDGFIEPSKFETLFDYLGILSQYLVYVKETGDFHGAHRGVAKKLNRPVVSVTREFKLAAKEFIQIYEL